MHGVLKFEMLSEVARRMKMSGAVAALFRDIQH
jgi:hypothetical protein